MSVATVTVLPREPRFPHLLPPVPRTRPIPLRNAGYEPMYGRMKEYRDLQREMDELSEEEHELEEMDNNIRTRGCKTVVPIGRVKTQQDERKGSGEDDEGDSAISGGPPSVMESEEEQEQEEEEVEVDLDASMEDLDEESSDEEEEEEQDLDMDIPEDIDASHSF
ncbi:uncharacterized protein BT62DRAFT_926110 [Guyanagaster necrorhizus]|uniref:Uncharacterized protein n=1 Tax=Guyanagaster necrorhizus TaxID=856835 RepID=A0A9P7W4C0_9AGAR|nr:uncharacterized protein BT62DRAFT_926110 [Guyanagaster necrorhizus MCA 3950]KAG7451917.1 hypothetical protein BT62DRAFT_926110 [Guyanagaster necrorhizus MCA 3950]